MRLKFQKWVPDASLNRRIYEDWIGGLDEEEAIADDVAYPLEFRDGHEILTASAFLGISLGEMRTLDFGMGLAGWARVAKSLGCQSSGTDFAQDRIDAAAGYGIQTVELDNLGTYHFINTEQVMEHVTELRDVMDRLAAALIPGGILKVSVPNGERADQVVERLRQGTAAGTRNEMMPVDPLEHVNTFNRASILALGGSLGLREVRPGLISDTRSQPGAGLSIWPGQGRW